MTNATEKLKDGAAALQEADAAVTQTVLPVQHSRFVRIAGTISEIADQPQMRSLSAALIAVGLLGRHRRLARAGIRMLIAHELATATKNFVKNRVDRTRPRSLDDGEEPRLRPGDNHDKEETSFPSGHSAGAAATARAFAREFPEYRIPAYAGAGLVSIAQVPRCAHYPTDVGAGLAVGLASEAVVAWLFPGPRGERDQ
ncbi:MAG TPA: phosphatase PAP2 family protein [Allosphingosinicella sp.]|jgi:membrane-associated phospholipid phosphatase|uniref:phosphatase PAP2 family protein n=1 Tax=Allosphingosinicella sp. TaxID=2823234 RepID=UPI002F2A8078